MAIAEGLSPDINKYREEDYCKLLYIVRKHIGAHAGVNELYEEGNMIALLDEFPCPYQISHITLTEIMMRKIPTTEDMMIPIYYILYFPSNDTYRTTIITPRLYNRALDIQCFEEKLKQGGRGESLQNYGVSNVSAYALPAAITGMHRFKPR
ncbi:MAG: hypothetical protein Q7S72_02085 [Candidatus Taylorbacteria bacterium]|nr:hypothetical protein [Candidatus Taylorbacteria bacterium]